jgi:hypothetical protein
MRSRLGYGMLSRPPLTWCCHPGTLHKTWVPKSSRQPHGVAACRGGTLTGGVHAIVLRRCLLLVLDTHVYKQAQQACTSACACVNTCRGSALHMAQLAAQAQRRRCKEMIGALPCGSGTSSTTAPDSLEECITEDDGAVGGGADSAPAPCTSHSVTSAHSSVNSRSGSQPRHAGGSRPLPGAVAPPSKECSSSGGGGASAPTAAAHTSTDLSHLPPILAAAERAERAARAAARSLLCESSVRESHIPPLQPPPSLPQAPEAAHLNSACMWSRIRAAAQL